MLENMSGFVGQAVQAERQRGAHARGIGAAQERMEQLLLHDREAHLARISASGWQRPMPPSRRWRQVLTARLVELATRIEPAATARVRQRAQVQ
jgi:hypothetical protein